MIGRTKITLVILLAIFKITLIDAQVVRGKLVDQNGSTIIGTQLHLQGTDYYSLSNASGIFRFFDVENGTYNLVVDGEDQILTTFDVVGEDLELGPITAQAQDQERVTPELISVISADDLEQIQSDEGDNFSSLLVASRDPFEAAVSYNLSSGRYRTRGLNNEDNEILLNGMPMNDLDDGRVFWNFWGGLNDVLRNQTNSFGTKYTDFSYGNNASTSLLDLRASVQRVQTKVAYINSNRSYTNQIRLTHATGMNEKGWAIAASVGKRWAQEAYFAGSHYDAYSYFLSVDKKLNDNHTLNAVFLGAPLRRGKGSPIVDEVRELYDDPYYNPNWGFQNGEVRNSREDRIHQPIAMLRHDWKIGDKTTITSTLGYQFGKYGNTRLDWLFAPDPRPDYYRNLPSFQEGQAAQDAVAAYLTADEANRQVPWDEFFEVNRSRNVNLNLAGKNVTGNLAAYIVEEQRFDNKKLSFNSYVNHTLSDFITLTGGVRVMREDNHIFKVLDDLLGAEFSLDINEFALRDFPNSADALQSDLNNPNRVITEGDVFGWDYDLFTNQAVAWAQGLWSKGRLDINVSGKFGVNSFYRQGNYRTGTFPESSFGDSETQSFNIFGGKAGLTYKIDGRNYLYGSTSYEERAPFSRFAYLSPRTRDQVAPNLTTEKIFSTEAGYYFRYAKLQGKIAGYWIEMNDQIKNSSFYNDEQRTFVNYVQSGIDRRHAGLEFGAQYQITSTLAISAAAGVGQYIFTSRPTATITADNSSEVIAEGRTIYAKNYYVPGSPQTAGNVKLEYRSPKYWFINLSGNYFANNYLEFNPDRRTAVGVDGVIKSENPELYSEILDQVELPAAFTMDLFAGKSWKKGNKYIQASLSVGNLLNNRDFRTGGFEQFRFDYEGKDVDRFPPRYFFAYGTNYTFNFSISLD